MNTAVDFAARLIDPAAIRDAGHSAVIAYVAPSRPGSNFGAKPVTKEYADQLRGVGLELVSIWQFGKPGNAKAPSDWTTGYDGGQRMGREAADRHRAAGGPDRAPIYFAVDEDISLDQWNTQAVEFFRGANAALGVERTGIYGHSRVCAWAVQDGVVGSAGGGKFWAWQTRAWSSNEIAPEAVLYQRVIDTPSNPGPLIDGSSVDVNDILAPIYGQWSHYEKEDPPMAKPDYAELDRMGDSRSNRWGARITNFLLHTQEGNGSAESLASYLNNTGNGVSYHYTLRDGIVCDVVDTDYASWSVLDANSSTINLCFAGSRAGWSRDEWLAIRDDIRIAAWIAVQDAKKYGFATDVIAPPYCRADGISDHKYVTECLGIGTHTDVGPNFPWDVFESDVAEFATGAPAPAQPNAINDAAAANPWLGKRLTDGEATCPDGVGRFVEFENGHVYWYPSTGAHAIPASLFGKYSALGWEAGPLGYPITAATQLEHGEVQGFQGGAIYRQDVRDPYWVHGAIRERWNRTGYEAGPLGWPVSDEEQLSGGEARQRFEHGQIIWPGRRDTVALIDAEGPDTPVADHN